MSPEQANSGFIEYLYIDRRRLKSYFEQISSSAPKQEERTDHPGPTTDHQMVSAVLSHLSQHSPTANTPGAEPSQRRSPAALLLSSRLGRRARERSPVLGDMFFERFVGQRAWVEAQGVRLALWVLKPRGAADSEPYTFVIEDFQGEDWNAGYSSGATALQFLLTDLDPLPTEGREPPVRFPASPELLSSVDEASDGDMRSVLITTLSRQGIAIEPDAVVGGYTRLAHAFLLRVMDTHRAYHVDIERPGNSAGGASPMVEVSYDVVAEFAINPRTFLKRLGAKLGPVREVSCLYRVRHVFMETAKNGRAALTGYAIAISEVTGDAGEALLASPAEPASRRMKPPRDEQVDVAFITVLPEEYAAVRQCLENVRRAPATELEPNAFGWELGTIPSQEHERPYRAVLALAARAGNTSGAIATIKTIQRWSPRYVLLVGIAGGLPRDELTKGDVVVSTVIWAYQYGKLDGVFLPRHDFTYQVDDGLLRNALALSHTHRDWMKELPAAPTPGFQPKVLAGPIASGDMVVDELGDTFFTEVQKAWPRLQAVEMEGGGAAAAIENARSEGRGVGFLMVRGISDMPGSAKKKKKKKKTSSQTKERNEWKAFASGVAARFAVHLVRMGWPLPPRE